VGALFLIAMVASLVGAGMIETVLGAEDYFAEILASESQLRIGVLLEVINGVAVVGIAVMMFPILKKIDEALALGYVALRVVEGIIVFAAVLSPLTLLVLSQEYVTSAAANSSSLQAAAASLVALRGHLIGEMLGIFFSLGASLFYYLLYRSRLLPRLLTVWGLIAVVLVFAWNFLELIGYSIDAGIVFGLPIILNEIVLGIWLIAKGFNPSVISSQSANVLAAA